MQFLVRVRTAKGAVKKGTITAPNESALRKGLAKKGLELLASRMVEAAAAPAPAAAVTRGAPAPSPSPRSPDEPAPAARAMDPVEALENALAPELEDKLSQLEGLLQSAEQGGSLIPVNMFLETVILGDDELCVLGLCVVAKHALRRIAHGDGPDDVLRFLGERCGIQELISRLILGMAIDAGKVSTGIASGGLSKEESIRDVLRNSPGTEEELVRSLVARCLPFVEGFGDSEGLLTRIEIFEARWGECAGMDHPDELA